MWETLFLRGTWVQRWPQGKVLVGAFMLGLATPSHRSTAEIPDGWLEGIKVSLLKSWTAPGTPDDPESQCPEG